MPLRELIERSLSSGETQRSLAQKVGVSPGTINNIMMGMRVSLSTLVQFASFYNISVDELRMAPHKAKRSTPESKDSPAAHRTIPLLSSIQAGKFTDRTVPPHAGEADEFIETDARGERIFALRVTGDSMEPLFHPGEIVIVNPDLHCEPGNYIIVKTQENGEEATIKQLKKYGDQHYLHPLNPKYDDVPLNKNHKIVGKVVRKQMDF